MGMQSLLRLIYPPGCVSCGEHLDQEFALCGPCRRDTRFIGGLVCQTCGTPLPGEVDDGSESCDDCLTFPRPWFAGRAAVLYSGNARRMILALKHGDRTDLARPAAFWMAPRLRELTTGNTILTPIPAHWTRLLRRRYNQAALLTNELSGLSGVTHLQDGLIRTRSTRTQDATGRDERFANLANAIQPNPKRQHRIKGKDIVLIDDVMTSGATFTAATHACHQAGASRVCILTLARVAKDA